MQKQTIKDIDIKGKRVLCRVDFNVPLNEKREITDDARIAKSLPTIRYCIEQGAKLILTSHLGRPKGKRNPEFSLDPAAKHLSTLINQTVELIPEAVGAATEARVNAMKSGEVVLLENIRFYPEEEKNDAAFAKQLAQLADVYVNDAFGTAHRAHASTVGVADYLPAVAGFLLGKEIEYFDKAITHPDRPFMTILGGAKVSDKVKLIANLLDKADAILIGGAMAYTFYKVLGIGIGTSKFEPEGLEPAREALEKAKQKNVPIIFPVDRVIAQEFKKDPETQVVAGDIPDGWMGLDIGPESVKKFNETLSKAKTIVWNGPVGVFEMSPFDKGTRGIAEFIAKLDATTIIGGGDTAAAIKLFGLEDKVSHVSTGGGASLEYLEGTLLPGVAALRDKDQTAAASGGQSS